MSSTCPAFPTMIKNLHWPLILQATLFLLAALLPITIVFKGLPSEFSYNVPWMKSALHQTFSNESILNISTLFKNPILSTTSSLSNSYKLNYLCVALLNILLFFLGSYYLNGAQIVKALVFNAIFFITSAKLLLTGTSSSFSLSILLIGYALYTENRKKIFYLFNATFFWIYPIPILLLLLLQGISLLKKRRLLELFLMTIGFSLNSILWKMTRANHLESTLYSSFTTFSELLRDSYLYGQSAIDLADQATLKSVFLSMLFDNSKLGSTVLSLSPQGTMRSLLIVLIVLGLASNRARLIPAIKRVLPLASVAFAMYVCSLALLFLLYFPNRYIEAPLTLILTYLAAESFWLIPYRKVLATISIIAATIYFQFQNFFPSIINTRNYLNYQNLIVHKIDYPRLIDFLEQLPFTEVHYMATPRLSELVMYQSSSLTPYQSYKYVDRSYELRNRSENFWAIYSTGSADLIKKKCRQAGVDLIIFEMTFLKLLKEKNWATLGRSILSPHRENIETDNLPFIDTHINPDYEIGDFKIIYCSPRLEKFAFHHSSRSHLTTARREF